MRLLRALAPVTCAVAFVVVCVPQGPTRAIRAAGQRIIDPICRVVLDPHNKFTSVGAPAALRNRFGLTSSANLSTVTVNYTGFTPQAQAAFQAAVDIWQSLVQSSVPIVVDAEFHDLGDPGLLGRAGSNIVREVPNGRPGTWYPFPLANKLAGSDLAGEVTSHIAAEFNSTAAWYYGTNGATPEGLVDFESVVLHELGHGFGFFGSGDVNGTAGTFGVIGFPFIYDVSVVDAGGVTVLNYPNNSNQLGTLLTSNALFWGGANGVGANGGARPRLYAPQAFNPGSSYSHLDDATYPAGNINSLMTPAIGFAESIHTPGPITLGMFRDMGWTTAVGAGGCVYTLSPSAVTVPPGGATASVALTTQQGCNWTAVSNDTGIATITSAASGTGSATIAYTVDANSSASFRAATLTIGGQTFTINQNGTGPAVAIDRSTLVFGATNNGVTLVNKTAAQVVRLTQSGSGTGTATWTATSNRPWLTVTPASSSGSGTLAIGVTFAPGLTTTQTGTITIAFTGAGNAATFAINVRLNVVSGGVPFGSFDTPLSGTSGVTGSVAVTGWALDDVEVSAVRIFRDPVAGEGAGVMFVGNAVFVDGARTDIVSAFPTHPRNTRAGWGYLLLTNFLPNQGNGTFRIHAYASDAEGHSMLLGSKTITCSNATSLAPFGAIDTPAQGETVSGTINNFGWTLIRSATGARADVPGGATVSVVIDGASVGSPSGWTSRADISALFPTGFTSTASAVAFRPIKTTTLTNGVHTIAWVVTATNGQGAGIGSRYFTVSNNSLLLDPLESSETSAAKEMSTPKILEMPRAAAMRIGSAATLDDEISSAPIDPAPLRGRRGFALDARPKTYKALNGLTTIQSEELDRIELHLGEGRNYAGYLRTPSGVAALPIGSHIDPSTGVFTWQPGVGFVGAYNFTFVRWRSGRAIARRDVRVLLNPKGSGRVGPQVVIDVPSATGAGRVFRPGAPILVAGWAADLESDFDSGVDTVHVWAYPVIDNGTRHGDPLFIGVAAYGGSRPDVAAVYGDRFKKSGYGIVTSDLGPGTYDIAVFAYSTVAGGFMPARTVRATIR